MPGDFDALNMRFNKASQVFSQDIGIDINISKHIAALEKERLKLRKEFSHHLTEDERARFEVRAYQLHGQLQVLLKLQADFNALAQVFSGVRGTMSEAQRAAFLSHSRKLADDFYYGISRYDNQFIEKVELYAGPIIHVVDDYSKALGHTLNVERGVQLEQSIQTIIDEADKLQTRFKRYEQAFIGAKPPESLKARLQALSHTAHAIKKNYLVRLEPGENRVPNPQGSEVEKAAFKALAELAHLGAEFKREAEKPEGKAVMQRGSQDLITHGIDTLSALKLEDEEDPLHIRDGVNLKNALATLIDSGDKLSKQFKEYRAQILTLSAKPSENLVEQLEGALERAKNCQEALGEITAGEPSFPAVGTELHHQLLELALILTLFEAEAQKPTVKAVMDRSESDFLAILDSVRTIIKPKRSSAAAASSSAERDARHSPDTVAHHAYEEATEMTGLRSASRAAPIAERKVLSVTGDMQAKFRGALRMFESRIEKHIEQLKKEQVKLRLKFSHNLEPEARTKHDENAYRVHGVLETLSNMQQATQKISKQFGPHMSSAQQHVFLEEGRKLADSFYYGIARYDASLIQNVEQYTGDMVDVIDACSNMMDAPLGIRKGQTLESTIQNMIDEGEKLQARFRQYKSEFTGHKPTPELERQVQTLLDKANAIKSTYLVHLESGASHMPNPQGSEKERATFKALAELAYLASMFNIDASKPEVSKVLMRGSSDFIKKGTARMEALPLEDALEVKRGIVLKETVALMLHEGQAIKQQLDNYKPGLFGSKPTDVLKSSLDELLKSLNDLNDDYLVHVQEADRKVPDRSGGEKERRAFDLLAQIYQLSQSFNVQAKVPQNQSVLKKSALKFIEKGTSVFDEIAKSIWNLDVRKTGRERQIVEKKTADMTELLFPGFKVAHLFALGAQGDTLLKDALHLASPTDQLNTKKFDIAALDKIYQSLPEDDESVFDEGDEPLSQYEIRAQYLKLKVMAIAAQYSFEKKVMAYGDVINALNLDDDDLPTIAVILDDILGSAANEGQMTVDLIGNMLNRVFQDDAEFSAQGQTEIFKRVLSSIVYADMRDSKKTQILHDILPNIIDALLVQGAFLSSNAVKSLLEPVLTGDFELDVKLHAIAAAVGSISYEDENLSSEAKVGMLYQLIEEGIRQLVDNKAQGALSAEHVSELFSSISEGLQLEALIQLQVAAIYFILYEPRIVEEAERDALAQALRDQIYVYLDNPKNREGYTPEEYGRLIEMVDGIDMNAFKPEGTAEKTVSYREALKEHTQKGPEDKDENLPASGIG